MYVVTCTTHDNGGTSKFVDGCANIGMQMLGIPSDILGLVDLTWKTRWIYILLSDCDIDKDDDVQI